MLKINNYKEGKLKKTGPMVPRIFNLQFRSEYTYNKIYKFYERVASVPLELEAAHNAHMT